MDGKGKVKGRERTIAEDEGKVEKERDKSVKVRWIGLMEKWKGC